ncbi:MAG: alpha-L-fucosidase, partial [Promethearchaeota archaeon]
GELTAAVKKRGMKMGFYYSGALDWSFNPNPIIDGKTFATNGPTEREYTEYANHHWYELIDKYEPLILWNDIGYPPNTNVHEIFAYFYNKFPDGVINDRWIQFHKSEFKHPRVRHRDFTTPEYQRMLNITDFKWESTRGVGNSYGYNQFETEKDYLNSEELIKLLVDIVSKNGNLLLNLGPKADGSIPELQKKAVLGLGKWLEINGEAIYDTRPWGKAEGKTTDGIDIRFTQKDDSLFIHLLNKPRENEVIIKSLKVSDKTTVKLLGQERILDWIIVGENLKVSIPENFLDKTVSVLKITPKPTPN